MALPTFDPETQVIVNRQNRPTTVFTPDKRPITVQPWLHVGPGGVVRSPEGTYVLMGEMAKDYVKFVSPAGPLYFMSRREAEVTLGKSFRSVVGGGPVGRTGTATPLGESVLTAQAKAGARAAAVAPAPAPAARVAGAAGAGAAPVTPVPVAPAKPANTSADPVDGAEGDGPEIELQTAKELGAMKFNDLKAYAANWKIIGPSRQALMDKLTDGGYIAPAE